MKRRRVMTGDEARLWASVARQIAPLKGRDPFEAPVPPADAPPSDPQGAKAGAAKAGAGNAGARGHMAPPPAVGTLLSRPPPAVARPAVPLPQQPLERTVRRRIAKGRLPIEGRIDLHDMTQAVAFDALAGFLRRAQGRGLRHVLVITGHGSASAGSPGRGVLRRQLPLWLEGAVFRPLVSSFEPAERRHGGDGAFYVRVRRAG